MQRSQNFSVSIQRNVKSADIKNQKSDAWSTKSSAFRFGPQTPLKTARFQKNDGIELTIPSPLSTSNLKSKAKRSHNIEKHVPSGVLFGAMRAAEFDASRLNNKLKDLEPTVKALASKYPRKSSQSPHRRSTSAKKDEQQDTGYSLVPPVGEKLITVGGYIISLQASPRDDITSIIKPVVSSGKEGFEVEVRILGCHPTEIKIEKRYESLLVIGVVPRPIPKSPLGLKSTYHGEGVSSQGREFMMSQGYLLSRTTQPLSSHANHPGGISSLSVPFGTEHLDEIKELVNIFVPKNLSVNQVFCSSPDAKGRMFIKGP